MSTNPTTPRVKLDVESFVATDENGASVHVRTDNDLSLKFKNGEVAPHDRGEIHVAMVLAVDGETIDLILIDKGGYPMVEILRQVREAAEQALEGLKGAPLAQST